MSLRISSAALTLGLLGACTGSESAPPPAGDGIECAIGAGAEFAEVCKLERVAGTQQIILHHPDGGFRRLIVDPATGTLAAADGAEPLVLEPAQGVIQFALAGDRYRISREPAAAPSL